MIVDSGDEIYVWVGKTASSAEKEKAQELAKVKAFPIFHHALDSRKFCRLSAHQNYYEGLKTPLIWIRFSLT